MREQGGPAVGGTILELSCDESVSTHDLDMGMREYACACGATHAVVTDVHPLSRFFPEFLVEILAETIEPEGGDWETFGMVHLMGVVMEEFPQQIAVADVAEDGQVGYAVVWVADFDSRRLHAVVTELVLELMEHAVSHAEDEAAIAQFESDLLSFDVETFVDQYRAQRDWGDEHDSPV